jgi:SAM-dependent methyltransferase
MNSDLPFWEQPEQVERFAAREPDERLLGLLERFEHADDVRVLDLGCAGGRNAVAVAGTGATVWAIDRSEAMVEKTRERLTALIGEVAARRHALTGRMDDLSRFADGLFDLVVALGVYHNARSREEWDAALSETARVLKSGGLLLVAAFTPETDLTGEGVTPVVDEPPVYEGFPSGRAVLVDQDSLDEAMSDHGLRPEEPSTTVTKVTESGRRVTVNALYRKQ